MTILGIDTATRVTSVGVRRNGEAIAERREESRGGHAASLSRLVAETLDHCGIGPAELDGIGVSEGPGSFTGLRVGVSFAKGLAYVTGATLVGVSTPRALARAAGAADGPIGVCLDARRGEVYLAVYEGPTLREVQAPVALRPEDAVAKLRALEVRTLLGDADERYADAFVGLGARSLGLAGLSPTGTAVAFEAEQRLQRGERASASDLVPLYIRASEAEIRHQEASLTREKTL